MTEKEKICEWMKNRLAQTSIDAYSGKIDKISKDLNSKSMLSVDSLYQIKNPTEIESIKKDWYAIPEFKQNDDRGRRQESNAINRYVDFRIHEQKLGLNNEVVSDISTPFTPLIESDSYLFALEEHLQDFLIGNLSIIKKHKLTLYDNGDRKGKEYPTTVGPIDILTTDSNGDFYVFETKLSRGVDRALGQILRYMGWVKKNLAGDKNVFGIIVANKMDEKIKYAVEMTPNVILCEYEMKFEVNFLDKM